MELLIFILALPIILILMAIFGGVFMKLFEIIAVPIAYLFVVLPYRTFKKAWKIIAAE